MRSDDRACPFCATASERRPSRAAASIAIASALALTACQPAKEDDRATADRVRARGSGSVDGGDVAMPPPFDAAPPFVDPPAPSYGMPPVATLPIAPSPSGAASSSSAAASVIGTATPRFKRCYEEELVKDPAAHGDTKLMVEIDAAGKVTSATTSPGDLSPRLRTCLEGVAKSLTFPASETKETVVVPLHFAPK